MSRATTRRGGRTGGNTDDAVSREEVFDLLSNRRRRHTLHYLRQQKEERPVDLRELSTQLSAWETGTPPEAITHKQRKRVYTALRQTHLPKMDRTGVVDYDAARGVVEPTAELEDVEIYLDVVPGNEIPRSEYYLGLAAVCAGLLAAVGIGAFPFDQLPVFGWAVLIVAAFTVSAAVDVHYNRQRRLGCEGAPPDVEPPATDEE